MAIIISHKSALEYWRLHRGTKIDAAARQRRKSLPTSFPGIKEIREKTPFGLPRPINLMVGDQNAKWKSEFFKPRLYTGMVPDWSFVNIGDGVAVSAPAFCFFQMAGEHSLVKLIELGFELCGTYSLFPDDSSGESSDDKNPYGHPQLANTNALKAFTARLKGVNGQVKARRALRYIADGSASPMETRLVMLLTLPYKLGGYGLPMPVLNRRIDPGKTAKQRPGKDHYVCDLFWPAVNLAIEYDSNRYHTGAVRIAEDSKKRLN